MKIKITGMEFYSYHGCFREEKIVGTRFKVDVNLECDVMEAAMTDDLTKTVNYQQVHGLVKSIMKQPANILEHLCYKIIREIRQQFPQVVSCEVTVYKLNPSIGGKTEWVAVSGEE
ncbi:dihydroneopterin aldolase [Bacteroidales bacterium OttesenSCG-928-B11]|nr:dihydroneopterin aldolase [Bacteroidales bacterium OttesenSCG-928-B11]MDL2326359.1 dihydroneopterin aldolase [Bacteroidales bacterium OttesenSCG-928-A14]